MQGHSTQMNKITLVTLLVCLALPVAATNQEDAASDTVALAFVHARDAAHFQKISRIGRNAFRKQACGDRRFASGLILDVTYKTADPSTLPDSARKLAARPDGYTITARFGVGVCLVGKDSTGQPEYNVIIATYESRWNSFWRAWD